MKRVLVTGAANIGKAGVATIVYKWGQEFDSNEIVYDYLMQRGLPERQYCEAIANKGGIIYTRSEGAKGIFGVIRWVRKIIENNKYEVLHINSDSAYIAAAYIYAAKRAGLGNIYVHSHCTKIDDNNVLRRVLKTILHKICMPYVCTNTKKFLACSKLAGEWMFGKKCVESENYFTIYNGVEVEKYLFDDRTRNIYRSRLNVEDKLVLGNIGRFSFQKNHEFLIDVFAEFQRKYQDSVLLLVGSGELEGILRKKVEQYGIQEKVMFLGIRDDVPSLLNAMDVMVMPSFFEGLPVTLVEAQMASLACVLSENITDEAKFTKNVKYIKGYNVHEWVRNIWDISAYDRMRKEKDLIESKFNIRNAALELKEVLLKDLQ